MLISINLHNKSSGISIKTNCPPASFSFKGQATRRTTVKYGPFEKCPLMLLVHSKTISLSIWIFQESMVRFHVVDLKCKECGSYNTSREGEEGVSVAKIWFYQTS